MTNAKNPKNLEAAELSEAELECVAGGFTPVPIPDARVAFTPVPIPRVAAPVPSPAPPPDVLAALINTARSSG